ncbi:MAG: hypothetical protein DRP42_06555, partial [Tenericutes bacterium]
KILTVFSGTRKRAEDAENYAKATGCLWQGLGFVEGGGGLLGSTAELPPGSLYDVAEGEKIITPLGIKHSEHHLVRARLGRGLYYLDQPYSSQVKNTVEVNEKLLGTEVVSFMRPNARKYRHTKIFKDQSKFFFYNPPENLKHNIELIVEDSL